MEGERDRERERERETAKNRCRVDDFCEWVPVSSEMHFVHV